MAENIGRVEFIVGLDGRNLDREARQQGARLAKMGEEHGKEYGTEFGDSAEDDIDKSLNKAMQRLQSKWAKEGSLAGKTYGEHLAADSKAAFRRMERETVLALGNKKAFEKFAKNFDTIDDAVLELTGNVKRLSRQKIQIFDEDGKAILGEFKSFFQSFEAGPAMQQVDKWAGSLKGMQRQTEAAQRATRTLRDNFDQLRISLDNRSFDDLAERMGGAAFAAIHLSDQMNILAEQGGVTDAEFHRFNATLEKHVERSEEAARKTQETIDKQHVLALQFNESRDRAQGLDRAMADLNARMGDRATFDRYVHAVGDLHLAYQDLQRDIGAAGRDFDLTAKQSEALTRKLDNLAIAHEDAAAAADHNAGRTQHLALQFDTARDRAHALDLSMADLNSRMGDTNAFRRYVRQVGSVDRAHGDLQARIRALAGAFRLPAKAVEAMTRKVDNLAEAFVNAGQAASGGEGGGFGGRLQSMLGAKGGLSTGAIIGLVAAVIEPAAVAIQGLAAAISALIGVLGAALAGAAAIGVAGLAGIVWMATKAMSAIKLMKDEFPPAQAAMNRLKKAAENDSRAFARAWGPALAEFSDTLAKLWRDDKMGEASGKAMAEITKSFTAVLKSPAYLAFQTAMETSIPNALANLGRAGASGLSGILNIIAAAGPSLQRVTGLLDDFADTWADKIQGQADSGELGKTIDGLVDDLLLLLDVVKRVWDATTKFFDKGRESGRRLLEMIGETFDTWSKWMDSVEGNQALKRFFDSGEKLVQSLLDNLPKLQKMFDGIVTPEAVDRLTGLLDQIGDFAAGPLVELTQAIGALDVFGTIATVLNDILTPLKPLFDILTPILSIVSLIIEAFSRMAGLILTILAPAFIPLRFAWEAVNTAFEKFMEWSQPIFDAFEEIGTAIGEAADAIWVALEPAIGDLADAFLGLLPSPAELARILRENVIPMIATLRDWIVNKLVPKIQEFADHIQTLVDKHGGWDQIMKDVEQTFKDVKKWLETDGIKILDRVVTAVENIVDAWVIMNDTIEGIKRALNIAKAAFDIFFHAFSGMPQWLSDTINGILEFLNLKDKATAAGGGGGGGFARPTARGAMAFGPQLRLIAEAGPEAVVPLRRPLSQVDPSVRALSAFAQGLRLPGDTGGGAGGGATGGTGRVVNVQAGAVQILGDRAPEATATNVVNRIAERIG